MPKRKTAGKFALVEKEILYSQSWVSLNDSAKVVYLHLKGEFTGSNGDNLKLPYCDMKRIMSSATFWKGIKSLEESGFIEILVHGGLEKKVNIYKLTGAWRLREKSLAQFQDEFKKKAERRVYRGVSN